jgi:hypothetical protein
MLRMGREARLRAAAECGLDRHVDALCALYREAVAA